MPPKKPSSTSTYRPRYSADGDALPASPLLPKKKSWVRRAIHVFTARALWDRIENAIRIAVVGTIPAAAIVFCTYRVDLSLWISQTNLISGALNAITGKETVGLQVGYFGQFFRAACIWLPVIMVEMVLHLYEYTAAWIFVYLVANFLMCCLMDGNTRKTAMMLLTIATMNMLRKNTDQVSQPARIGMEWLLGGLLGAFGALLPWPALSTKLMEHRMTDSCQHIAELLQQLTSCMWTDTSLQRSINMAHVRVKIRCLDEAFDGVKSHKDGTTQEWFLETVSRRKLRGWKMNLYTELYRNEDSIRRVLEIIRDRPYMIDNAERAHLFKDRIESPIEEISDVCTLILQHIDKCHSRHSVLKASELYNRLEAAESNLQAQFQLARAAYVMSCTSATAAAAAASNAAGNTMESSAVKSLEEFIPLITFYVFCVSQICRTLVRMRDAVHHSLAADQMDHTHRWCRRAREAQSSVWALTVSIFTETQTRASNLVFRRAPEDIRHVIEAAKTSSAMLAALGFYAYMNTSTAFLSGPTVIASIASTNPAEAVILAVPRLSGTLMGVVLGFFVAQTATSSVAIVAGLISLIFLSRLAAQVKNIGPSFSNAAFVAVSQLSVIPLTQDATMSRIQQTTFAVFIYILITMLVFPCRPTALLREARAKALRGVVEIFRLNMDVVIDTASAFAQLCPSSPESNSNEPIANHPNLGLANQTVNFLDLGGSMAASFIEYPREAFATIEKKIKSVEGMINSCQTLMPFAADEPSLGAIAYPSRACSEVHVALKKSLGLLRTMLLGVRLMRERKEIPSLPLLVVLRRMVPCARDVSLESKKFAGLMSAFIEYGDPAVHDELLESSHALSMLSGTLHHMQSAGILKAVKQTMDQHEMAESFNLSTAQYPPVIAEEPSVIADDDDQHTALTSTVGSIMGGRGGIAALRSEVLRVINAEGLHSFTMADFDTIAASAAKMWIQDAPNAPSTSVAARASPLQSQQYQYQGSFASVVDAASLDARQLSAQDAEAMHTMTFIVVLLAAELRKVLVGVEDLWPANWLPSDTGSPKKVSVINMRHS
ncbi:transmembrane protein, putative [Bodo saltans]|uniref:Transmembrane protein, putative n=1 Tax=Bodo saltans TaxID=75058 RepID=A0A0S4ILS6_BODSA|nr:transmembrane protein, putative [Bodo saltans]|eukprot:CUE71412.1 transmembrane protein, putative [Bodo saltans]